MIEYIKKTSGLKEPFNEKKIVRSLRQIGANKEIIQSILDEITQQYPHIKNTQHVFEIALEKLKQYNIGMASRYNLKKALLALGPAGYPFEQFVSALFEIQKYTVATNVNAQGFCVDHELDVVAIKDGIHNVIECKFHNQQRYKSDLKVSLYVNARFQDMQQYWKGDPGDTHKEHKAWIVTNTSFTQETIKYAECTHIKLMSWKYPKNNGIRDIVKKYKLHPITALVNLSPKQKKILLKNELVLCRDIKENKQLLRSLGFSTKEAQQLIREAKETCEV